MLFQEAMSVLNDTRHIWDAPFTDVCLIAADSVGELRGPELAELLRWCDDNHCYYHGEICALVSAATNEAARRLEKL